MPDRNNAAFAVPCRLRGDCVKIRHIELRSRGRDDESGVGAESVYWGGRGYVARNELEGGLGGAVEG